jgi:hypothetical protein
MVKMKAFPKHKAPFLISGWSPDAGETGWQAIDFINKRLAAREFADIEPTGFFSLGGVDIKENVCMFPESRFFSSEKKDLIFFKSNSPSIKGYQFLNLVLDVAKSFNVQGVYSVGGMLSMIPHTTSPRKVVAVFNSPRLKADLAAYDLMTDLDYRGTPSMNGFLVWVAGKRELPAACFMVNVPFYLADRVDPRAGKAVLEFLNLRFGLGIDLSVLDREIEIQDRKIERIRKNNSFFDSQMTKLENKMELSHEEMEGLLDELNRFMD